MELDLLFQFAILLLAGLAGARLIRLIRLPDVTGYLILGLLIGPSVLGIFTSGGYRGPDGGVGRGTGLYRLYGRRRVQV